MLARWFSGLTVLCLVAAVTPARAEDKPKPTLTVGVRSLDALLKDVGYLATLAGEDEQARQVEQMIRARITDKGLEGIDHKRPFGLYAAFGTEPKNTAAVLMVPVADEKAFLSLLDTLKIDAAKDEDGLYKLTTDFIPKQVPLYLRLANKYAYVTALSPAALAKNRVLGPEAIMPAAKDALAAGVLHLDRVPKTARDIALSQVEKGLKKAEGEGPREEGEEQRAFRVQFLKEIGATVKTILEEGKEFGLQVQVDRKAGKLTGEFHLTGKPDTTLAEQIARISQRTSLFGSLASSDSAAGKAVHFTIPENLRKTLQPLLEKAIKHIEDNESDATKRDIEVRFIKALLPTVNAGVIDSGSNLRGPSKGGKYTAVVGIRLKDPGDLEKVVKDALKLVPKEEQGRIKMDLAKEGGVAIHRLDIRDRLEEAKNAKKVFGDAYLYFAFRKDAVILSLGEEGLEAIKDAIAAKPKATGFYRAEITMARLVPLISAVSDKEEITKLVKDSFGEDKKDPGKIRFSLDGGKALTARLSMTGAVVHFLARAGIEAAKARSARSE